MGEGERSDWVEGRYDSAYIARKENGIEGVYAARGLHHY